MKSQFNCLKSLKYVQSKPNHYYINMIKVICIIFVQILRVWDEQLLFNTNHVWNRVSNFQHFIILVTMFYII